ncbi:Putative ribonuclease H protein At1g65750 [Linum perenne]
MNLGRCSVTRAELRGAIHGLELVWSMGFRSVELQLDSKAAIDLLLATGEPRHQHVYREGNKVADFLASRGHDLPFGSHTFPLSDFNLVYLLRYDCLGISEPRHVVINS